MKTEEEIQDKRDDFSHRAHGESKWPGMTYEQGLRDALEWVLGVITDEEIDE